MTADIKKILDSAMALVIETKERTDDNQALDNLGHIQFLLTLAKSGLEGAK